MIPIPKPDAYVPSRILLIEDEVLIAMHIADTLESFGFEVIGP